MKTYRGKKNKDGMGGQVIWVERVDRIENTFESGISTETKNLLNLNFPEVSPDSLEFINIFRDRLLIPLVLLTRKEMFVNSDKKYSCRKPLLLELNDYLDFHLLPFLKSRMESWIKGLIKESMEEVEKKIRHSILIKKEIKQ